MSSKNTEANAEVAREIERLINGTGTGGQLIALLDRHYPPAPALDSDVAGLLNDGRFFAAHHIKNELTAVVLERLCDTLQASETARLEAQRNADHSQVIAKEYADKLAAAEAEIEGLKQKQNEDRSYSQGLISDCSVVCTGTLARPIAA